VELDQSKPDFLVVFSEKCPYDLFSSIPTLDGSKTVTQETFAWNETMKTSSKSRLFRGGHREDAPESGLDEGHILSLERLALEPEGMLGKSSMADQFDPSFTGRSITSRVR